MARTDYQRSFIIMHPLESGNPVKSGFCKMEAKNGRGRLTFTVQGFEPQEPGLKALLVRRLSAGAQVVDCGWVMVDGRGIGTMSYDFDPAAIDGAPYEAFNAVCICQSAQDIGFPLTGVVGGGGAVDWHGAVKPRIASLLGRETAEAADAPAEAEPTEQRPAEAEPTEQSPAESDPAAARPAEAEPMAARPAEAEPTKAVPAEMAPQAAGAVPDVLQPEVCAQAAQAKAPLYVVSKPDAAHADAAELLPEFRVHSGVIDTSALNAASDAQADDVVQPGAWQADADARDLATGGSASKPVAQNGAMTAHAPADKIEAVAKDPPTLGAHTAADVAPVEPIAGAHVAKTPVERASAADAPTGDMPTADGPADDLPVADTRGADGPADDVPVADAPVADIPEAAIPAADIPADPIPDVAATDPLPGEFIAGDLPADEPANLAFQHEPIPSDLPKDAPDGYEPLMDEIATLDAAIPDHLIDEIAPPAREADPVTPSMLSTLSFPIPALLEDWPGFAGQLRTLFDQFPRVEPFDVESFEFVRIPVPRGLQIDHYMVGLELEDGEPSTVCYCIPGSAADAPPAGLEGYQFRETAWNAGYWVTWADAATGETVPPKW